MQGLRYKCRRGAVISLPFTNGPAKVMLSEGRGIDTRLWSDGWIYHSIPGRWWIVRASTKRMRQLVSEGLCDILSLAGASSTESLQHLLLNRVWTNEATRSGHGGHRACCTTIRVGKAGSFCVPDDRYPYSSKGVWLDKGIKCNYLRTRSETNDSTGCALGFCSRAYV